jgi:hypothetical protein
MEKVLTGVKRNFKRETELTTYAYQMLEKYNLQSWQFIIAYAAQRKLLGGNTGTSDIGSCNLGFKVIFMPEEIVAELKLATLKDIFLHELAHAIAGRYSFGHNKRFREICKELGCKSYKASQNYHIFDMYGRYDITPAENLKCIQNYIRKHNN